MDKVARVKRTLRIEIARYSRLVTLEDSDDDDADEVSRAIDTIADAPKSIPPAKTKDGEGNTTASGVELPLEKTERQSPRARLRDLLRLRGR